MRVATLTHLHEEEAEGVATRGVGAAVLMPRALVPRTIDSQPLSLWSFHA